MGYKISIFFLGMKTTKQLFLLCIMALCIQQAFMKKVDKKRKLIEWPAWAQVGGCLGSAGCAAIVMASCSAETIATGPAGIAACAGTLTAAGAAGCKDALMSCSGKRRLAFMKVLEKAKERRALEWPAWAQVGGCLGSAGCSAIVMGSCSAETVAAGP